MTAEPASLNRVDRRRERTRNALLSAATAFLADGRTAVSIQEITDAADVGFGSFYNHFSSKDELFEEAVRAVLNTYGSLRDMVVAEYDDPAEVFAVSFRMTGRMQRDFPEGVRVILHSGTSILVRDEGLAPRARRDIAAAQEAGRFDLMDVEMAMMTAGGALLGLLQLLDRTPNADAGALTDQVTGRVLRMLGMSSEAAERLATNPLPRNLPKPFA
ncbi:TetR/AcrR family transcriptional regulator [Nocardia sp. NPDC060259]|uniref:TetR/AcrR family transcriptional regulator n=1 Tax=Nocardia sp. NPDC060259 TaxID=3347088 RepID=UPI0036609F2D